MLGDLTIGEIGRTVVRIEKRIGEVSRALQDLSGVVVGLQHQVTENTKDIDAIQRERTNQKRLIFTALVAPAIILVIGFSLQMLSIAGAG